MAGRLATIIAVIAAWPASASLAQSFDEAEQEALRARPVGNFEPIVFVSEYWWLAQHWTINTVHADWLGQGEDRERYWVVRRAVGDSTGQTALLWADSRICPAVRDVLIALETLEPARPEVVGLGLEDDRLGIVFDGARVIFRSRSARVESNGAVVELQLRGNVNAPHAVWWRESAEALGDCWTPEAPE